MGKRIFYVDTSGTVAHRHKEGFDSGNLSSAVPNILVPEMSASVCTRAILYCLQKTFAWFILLMSWIRAGKVLNDQGKKWLRLRYCPNFFFFFFFDNAKTDINLRCAKYCNWKTHIICNTWFLSQWMYRKISFRPFYLSYNYLLAETWIVLG